MLLHSANNYQLLLTYRHDAESHPVIHHAVHKAGWWVWSTWPTVDDTRPHPPSPSVDNNKSTVVASLYHTWRQWTCSGNFLKSTACDEAPEESTLILKIPKTVHETNSYSRQYWHMTGHMLSCWMTFKILQQKTTANLSSKTR